VTRVLAVMAVLLQRYQPTLAVVACNTASTLVLPQLRARFAVPFVGTVPAIKPACAASVSKRVSVLGTEATVAREYTRSLIRDFANGAQVTLVGAARLAGYAEAELHGEPATDEAIRSEIAPCFVEQDGTRTDTVVLACTHYPLLLPRTPGPLAGAIHRSGAGNRSPCMRSPGPFDGKHGEQACARCVHLGSLAPENARSGTGRFRAARRGQRFV
jgi:glutamate racemase